MSEAPAPIAMRVWDMKYRHKEPGGTPLDGDVAATWRRVARALAAAEPEAARPRHEAEFMAALEGYRFLPAGRILAGAGTRRNVTLFNCFVMGTIPDDMAGIFGHLKEAALTMQAGGGIGYDFSTLRPKGAAVKGVGADASGPLTFMDVWDSMCRTIMSAGHRRGAMMATMRCDHPDIEAFIEAKGDPGRLRMFNLSVLVTDAFMAAVESDDGWELRFEGVVHKTLGARELWDRIMRATYAYAEPGVIFIDRINRRNNLHYCETIRATNPCVTAASWVQTSHGPRQVAALIGRRFEAVVNGRACATDARGFFPTGRRRVVGLLTEAGYRVVLTPDHRVCRVVRPPGDAVETEWVEARRLCPGDEIMLHDHRGAPRWPGRHTESEGYLTGLLVGDGTLNEDAAVLSAWPGALAVNGGYERPGVGHVMDAACAAAREMTHRADSLGWHEIAGRGEHRMTLGALKRLAESLGLRPGRKAVTTAMHRASSAFHVGFLRGLFDSDGSVQGTRFEGAGVRLTQGDETLLLEVQRMLLRLGVVSRLHRNRRREGRPGLPDGLGGRRDHEAEARHELVVGRDSLLRFRQVIGFHDGDKARRLNMALAGSRRRIDRERFTVTVRALEPMGEEDVFDVAVPGVNAFDADGLVVHNCGEQPLPPYGACLLGSINLARCISRPFEDVAALDEAAFDRTVATAVRMMDNAIDVSRFPLEAQRREARAKRRIGLGVTGLADALIMMKARYGSEAAVELAESWMRRLKHAAYRASVELAREKGAFPLYDRDAFLAAEGVRELPADLRGLIERHGVRNALLTSIAPTGTISLFADNVSSGLEPVFAFSYTRNLLMPDGTRRSEEVADYALRLYRRLKGQDAPLPDFFVDAQALRPGDHVGMQAAVQKHVDSSISKTINLPEDIAFEDFKHVYLDAYRSGCKGCTTYRPNDVTGAVLETRRDAERSAEEGQPRLPLPEPADERPEDGLEAGGVVYMTRPLERPASLPGSTYKLRWPESDHALYVTINDVVRDGRRRPFEIFVNSKNMDHYAWTLGLTRMISAVFRRGGDVGFVVEELKAVFDPRGGQWLDGRYVPSLLAAIGEVIETHMVMIGFMTKGTPVVAGAAQRGRSSPETRSRAAAGDGRRVPDICPRCGQPSLLHQEGCNLCTACDYSKCA